MLANHQHHHHRSSRILGRSNEAKFPWRCEERKLVLGFIVFTAREPPEEALRDIYCWADARRLMMRPSLSTFALRWTHDRTARRLCSAFLQQCSRVFFSSSMFAIAAAIWLEKKILVCLVPAAARRGYVITDYRCDGGRFSRSPQNSWQFKNPISISSSESSINTGII